MGAGVSKLLLLTPSLDCGGAETVVADLALSMRKRGWEVQVVSMLEPRAFVAELQGAGTEVVSLGMKPKSLNVGGIVRLMRFLHGSRPSIVHAHMFHASVLARLLRPLLRIPVICTVHSTVEAAQDRDRAGLREWLYRITDRLCEHTTAVGEAARERYVAKGLTSRSRIVTIANGVDVERFKPDAEARERIRGAFDWGTRFVWMAVGRLELAKGYPTMLEAFQQVQAAFPDSLLTIAGEGRLRPQLEQLVVSLGLKDSVQFLGSRADVPDLLAACDAFLMSSAWEGGPIALLEASAAGVPVVSTVAGEASRIVRDGESGWLCPIGDAKRLAHRMQDIMNTPAEQRAAMGAAGRAHMVEKYSLQSTMDRYADLYSRCMGGRP